MHKFKYLLYKVTNKINQKIYFGITSKSLNERKRTHLNSVNKGKTTHFANALRCYGIQNFIWEEILYTQDYEIIKQSEINFIKIYNSNDKSIGYNMTIGGEGVIGLPPWNKGKPMLPHVREALSKASIGKKGHWTNKKRDFNTMKKLQEGRLKYFQEKGSSVARSVIVIDLNSGFPLFFKSIKEASKELNITKKRIYTNLKGSNNIKEYKFIYDSEIN